MSHANAALTPKARLKLGRLVVEDGWPVARAAEYFHVSWPTAKRWAKRYAEMGAAGVCDRSSRPHRSPTRTPTAVVKKIVRLRWKQRLSPLAIAARLGVAASTVHAVLVRCRLHRLSHVDIRTGEPIRRYEHDHPGALLDLLQEFAVRGVNLIQIQSRPTGEGMGKYCFAVDAEGHIAERRVAEALMGLKRITPKVRFLGSYPRAGVAPADLRPARPGTSDAAFIEAAEWLARCQDGRG